jgi:acyl-CoA reductase-like NAD-dependent aldehyde dehydrogenase
MLTIKNKKGRVVMATPDYWKAAAKAQKQREKAAAKRKSKERKKVVSHAKKTFRKAWRKLI